MFSVMGKLVWCNQRPPDFILPFQRPLVPRVEIIRLRIHCVVRIVLQGQLLGWSMAVHSSYIKTAVGARLCCLTFLWRLLKTLSLVRVAKVPLQGCRVNSVWRKQHRYWCSMWMMY